MALLNKHYSGHHKATEVEKDQRTHEREISTKKCGQQASSTAGGRWKQQQTTELDDRDKSGLWSVFHWD